MAEVTITIDGKAYRMACDPGQEEHLGMLGARFDAYVAHLRQSFGEIGDQRLLVMAAMIVLENDATGAQTEEHQIRMVGEVCNLVDGSTGVLDTAAAETTVDTLLGGGSDPVISGRPEGAWTSVVTDGL